MNFMFQKSSETKMKLSLAFAALFLAVFVVACIDSYPIEESVDTDVDVDAEDGDHGEPRTPDPTKTWPELVGRTGEEARDAILAEFPTLEVELIPTGWPLSIDFRPNRVRVLLCERGLVQSPPYIG